MIIPIGPYTIYLLHQSLSGLIMIDEEEQGRGLSLLIWDPYEWRWGWGKWDEDTRVWYVGLGPLFLYASSRD